MALDLANYEKKARLAVKAFWGGRASAAQKQLVSGKVDQGSRGAVTGGKNMDGFIQIVTDLVHANGFSHAEIHLKRNVLTLPGYFRPTKLWDLLILNQGRLIAALEFKSQVGPSFGNNFNNRTEEAIGRLMTFGLLIVKERLAKKQPSRSLGGSCLLKMRRNHVRRCGTHHHILRSSLNSKRPPISTATTFFAKNWFVSSSIPAQLFWLHQDRRHVTVHSRN